MPLPDPASTTAAPEDQYDATLTQPPGDVEGGDPITVRAQLTRTAPAPPPEPDQDTTELLLNGVVVARQDHFDMVQGDTLSLHASGLVPDSSPLVFGENVVAFESTEFSGRFEAGRFTLIQSAAVVTSLSFNKEKVDPGELFRATVIYENNTDTEVSRTLVINRVDRDANGNRVHQETLLNTDVTVQPGTNEGEFAIQMNEMDNIEELCAFVTEFTAQGVW